MTGTLEVTAIAHPLSFERQLATVDAGVTIADLLEQLGIPSWAWASTLVFIGDALIYPEFYHVVRPKPGQRVLVRVVPMGRPRNSGQRTGKSAAWIVLGVIHIVLGVIGTVTGGWGSVFLGPGIGFLLTGIMGFLTPLPKHQQPSLGGLAGTLNEPESPALSITGSQNAVRRYAPVPRIYGRHRVFPPYGALAFTETLGADQYLRLLFCIGLGPTEIDDLKIGDTPIENFEGVELEIRTGAAGEPPITLYTQETFEAPLSIVLLQNVAQIRTSQAGAIELSVDNIFPGGLVSFSSEGVKSATTVQITIDYRLVGQTAFVPTPLPSSTLTVTDARQSLTRAGARWKPQRPAGPYGAAAWSQLGFASFDAAKMNDGVLNVLAFDADAAPAGSWLMVDHGAPVDVGRVVVTSAGSGANCTWTVQGSNDLVAWDDLATAFSTGGAGTQSVEWANTTPHRYHRLLKTNAATAGPDYYEVEWWATTAGQYDVRETRLTADSADPLLHDQSVWSALRTVGADPPIALEGLALVAMRIKATDQLNGLVDNFNCIATSRHLDYATYAGTVLSESPIGYWRLGEILGAPTAFDASGQGRSGTYAGSPTLGVAGFITGDADTAMACDGTDDAVSSFVGLTAIDMGVTSFTLEIAFTVTTTAGVDYLFVKGSGDVFANGQTGWGIRRNGNSIEAVRNVGTGGAPTIVAVSTISVGTRYLAQVTYDKAAGTLRLALSTTSFEALSAQSSVGTGAYADTYGLLIGRYTGGNFWRGTIDEAVIIPRALTAPRREAHVAAANGTREWVVQRTSNPASHYREVLQGPQNARPVADTRLDLAELQKWHAENSSAGRSCNLVVDYVTTIYDLLRTIATCGRATPTMNDLKFATVRDLPQTVPVQHFTPRNSKNFRGRRQFTDLPHALKVRFVDPSSGWQQAERIVYDDGFNESNATRFEVFELLGVTDPDHAWRLARYHIAQARARQELYDLETDIEMLVCRRGDLVMLAHDVTEWGVSWGRIKAVFLTESADSLRDGTFWTQSGLSDFVAGRVNDGLTVLTAFTAEAAAPGSWLQIDLGGAPQRYVGVDISQGFTSVQWRVEYSDDAAAWQEAGLVVYGIPDATHSRGRWSDKGAHRYWRLFKIGGGSGLVNYTEVQWVVGAAPAIAITLDEITPMIGSQNYAVRIRLATGTSLVANLQTVAGDQTTLTFQAPGATPSPAVGDLAMVGLVGLESIPAIVAMIRPQHDLAAVLTFVDAAPGVLTADQGPVPPWDPQMTRPAHHEVVPPTPIITSLISDESVLVRDLDGSLRSRIVMALEYQATSNLRADYLDVRWRRSDATGPFEILAQLPPDSAEASIEGVEDGVAYDLRARTVNREGKTSPWAEVLGHVVIGKTTPPPTPTNLRLEGDRLAWDYATAPLDLLGFIIRRSPGPTGNFSTALAMHVGTAGASPFILPGTIYGEWTFLVAAIDTAGMLSTPASLTVDFGDPRLHNTVESYDYKANTFPGSITNGAVDGGTGNLEADQVTTGFWTLGGNLFWSASGATLFWQGTYEQMTYVFTFTPAGGSAGARILLQLDVQASGWSLEWKKGALDYAPFPGSLENIEAVQHTFRLITDASVIQGIVSLLKLFVDADDIEELHNNFASAVTTGSRLTLVNTYRAIKQVTGTILAAGGETAIASKVADQQNTAGAGNGPLMQGIDAAGAVVAAHHNVKVVGY